MRALFSRWRLRTEGRSWSTLTLGLICALVMIAAALGMAFNPTLQAMLGPGDTVTAEFKENYRGRVFPYTTTVKLAGVEIGTVSGVEATDRGTTLIHMKINEDLDKLHPKPSAAIEPHTILGGRFSIALYPGGGPGTFDPDNVIPPERTRLPVELDSILSALPGEARTSLQGTVKNLDATLAAGGSESLRQLVEDAPSTLGPAGRVLDAAQGTRPGQDLPQLVTNLESTAHVVNGRSRDLGSILENLHATTTVLARQSDALGSTIRGLPPTLEHTRTGLSDLDGTLHRLTTTARSFRPTAQELPTLLEKLGPVLQRARPVVSGLRPVLEDARPAVEELVPTSQQLTSVLDDVKGPVIDRVNGPVMDMLLNTWRGTGPYQGSGDGIQADHKFYEELGYMVTNLGRASQIHDPNGAALSFLVSAGPSGGVAGSLQFEELLRQLQLPGAPTGPNTRPVPPLGQALPPSLPGQPGNPAPALEPQPNAPGGGQR